MQEYRGKSSFIRFDIIRRILSKVFNINVVYVMNITDIDEKLVMRSVKTGQPAEHIANHYTDRFQVNLKRLNALPMITMRVTDYMPAIIRYIEKLIDNGSAYATPKALDDKENMKDFALWKVREPDGPVWESPWGQGRPGWHIECSVLASEAFGSNIDIHSGGSDLLFPHHENESAQSCCYHNTDRWTNYWIHSGLLRTLDDADKMSKSLGNVISIDQLLQHYSADHFRIFCLLSQYYKDIEFSDESMVKATKIHKKLTSLIMVANIYINNPERVDALDALLLERSLVVAQKAVRDALADNFDTPKAMSAIMSLVHVCNIELNRRTANPHVKRESKNTGVNSVAACVTYIETIMAHLGVSISPQRVQQESVRDSEKLTQVLNSVVSFREKVRGFGLGASTVGASKEVKEKVKAHRKTNAALLDSCDQLRHELSSLAQIEIKDHKNGQSYWSVAEKSKDGESDS